MYQKNDGTTAKVLHPPERVGTVVPFPISQIEQRREGAKQLLRVAEYVQVYM
jgi:hypothetical protein